MNFKNNKSGRMSVLYQICRLAKPFSSWPKPVFALLLTLACFDQLLAQTARTFSHPDRIHYDSQCLTIDGKDVFIYSGAFHYFRCPKELWPDRFQKIKDAGFNCVETYVAWNWCEPEMPASPSDFSKVSLTDLDDFLKMAERSGLYVIVRPGPYICAEWDTGGFPQWLLAKKPEKPIRSEGWLRSDDPVYLAWCKHWFDAVCPVIAKHQITRQPPGSPGVILFQVENEYDFAGLPGEVKANQVKALAQYALLDGIDVPLFTCWTHQVRGSRDPVLRQLFDCCNFYPRWNVEVELRPGIEKLRREQPDAPMGTTELQGGWFSQVGGTLSEEQDGVTAEQINNLTLFAIQCGDTILNYYMLFGGSNPGDWGSRNLTTSYDYNAPIREWGGVGDRYQRVWALGHLLREQGAKLARSMPVDCDATTSQNDVAVAERRAPDGSRYLFVRTSQHAGPRAGTATVKEKSGDTNEIVFAYQLESFGSKILYLPPGTTNAAQGEWLPKAAPHIERPTDLPAGVTITSARRHADPGPAHWTKLSPGADLAHAGIYDDRFLFYRAGIFSPSKTNLLVQFPNDDSVLATINGKRAARIGGTSGSSAFELPAGSSKVDLLYENLGHPNFGSDIDQPSGIFEARLTSSSLGAGKPIIGWRMHEVNDTTNPPEVKTDFKDDGWTHVSVGNVDAHNLPAGHMAVYRASVEIPPADFSGGKLVLNFGRIDDLGWVYVNGTKTGETTDWSRAYSLDATKELHPGKNLIAVIVKNNEGEGGLGAPELAHKSDEQSVKLSAFGGPAGDERQWWKPDFNDWRWETVTIGSDSSLTNALLTWYRMNFQLPPAKTGVWVPWHLHLKATGNGFLYLNGHAIGRYWEVGPQHDFFLPECWLNFGPGRNNQLTLSLRPLDQSAFIQSAVVEPYAGFAEKARSEVPSNQPASHNFGIWEKEITAFEASDRTNPPPTLAVLFIGSSTIKFWTTLAADFPGQPVLNRGFGGSEIVDSIHFADRILFPYAPRKIFFRAGGNDIADGKSPESVFEDFKEFAGKVHARLPDTEIFFISWNPTIARWANRDKEKFLNERVKAFAKQTPHLKYIETGDLVLGADGKPRPELFRADKLHFSAAGYKLLADRVRPFLSQ